MAKDTYYFSHDYNARNDKKISALVREFKSSGYGIFWATCEMMHEEGGTLEFDDLTIDAIAKDINEESEFVKTVLDKCIEKYKLFIKDDILLQSSRVHRNLESKNEKRTVKAEAGRLGGIKSGESRRNNNLSKQNEAVLQPASSNEPKESKVKEIKGKESISPPNLILNGNHNRQPVIPTKNQVWEVFSRSGGTKEMAKAFFEKHDGTGWFIGNSPITNFSSLANKFIDNWKRNEQDKQPKDHTKVKIALR